MLFAKVIAQAFSKAGKIIIQAESIKYKLVFAVLCNCLCSIHHYFLRISFMNVQTVQTVVSCPANYHGCPPGYEAIASER